MYYHILNIIKEIGKKFKMSLQQINLKVIEREWLKIKDVISFPHTKKQYKIMVSYLDLLIDEVYEEKNSPPQKNIIQFLL